VIKIKQYQQTKIQQVPFLLLFAIAKSLDQLALMVACNICAFPLLRGGWSVSAPNLSNVALVLDPIGNCVGGLLAGTSGFPSNNRDDGRMNVLCNRRTFAETMQTNDNFQK
jgi:hypothetical protein